MRSVSVAAAVNNLLVLENCLGRSPDIRGGDLSLRTYEGARSAGAAYNQALDETSDEILVFAHQDVYLPAGFLTRLHAQISLLDRMDPDWALAGAVGLDEHHGVQGRTWSSGMGQLVGRAIREPTAIATLDEMLLIVRRASGCRFDDEMPSFHLYAADAVQTAKARGLKSYVIDVPAIHHSRAVVALDDGYQRAYRYMQRKWWKQLPIPNLVCPITRSPLTLFLRDLRIRRKNRGKPRPPEPSDNPSVIAQRLGYEPPAG